ncbi:hypothetical protein RhiirA5_438504 [Rhizophagus irregularis]|uniref:TLDc domain-containing protein n=1 Tax=Rhizophagus irregularis TaxID=588596 RepID=A0A2N0NJ19_9GLOM|nr:hypothetical protein RhiirA5_438504 [Rhizophagus irregularis]
MLFLKYLYAGYVDITDKIGTELLNIIIASDEFNLTRLTKDYIIEYHQLLQNDLVGALKLRDVSQWSQDDIMTFKRIICRFIPLIRFKDISPKDYMIKIKPYEEILSKEYRNNLLNYYMIPECKPKLNNLTSRYLKDINSEFHKKCDNRGATIIVLKTKNSERIIGEYNPLEWDPTNGSFKCMKDNFYSHLQIKRMSKWQKVGYSNG